MLWIVEFAKLLLLVAFVILSRRSQSSLARSSAVSSLIALYLFSLYSLFVATQSVYYGILARYAILLAAYGLAVSINTLEYGVPSPIR
jgi:hypothetical protein